MKTEQIIETLREYSIFLCECEDEPPKDPEGLQLTIHAAIEQLQTLETELREAWSYLNKLGSGHPFAIAAWDSMHMKKSMDDMSWMRMVAALAVKKVIMDGVE